MSLNFQTLHTHDDFISAAALSENAIDIFTHCLSVWILIVFSAQWTVNTGSIQFMVVIAHYHHEV